MPTPRTTAKTSSALIIALDGPLSDGCKRDTVPDMPGDDRVHQYLRVRRQIAQPRRQIDDISDRRVVEAAVHSRGSDGRGSHRDAHAEAYGAATGLPVIGKGLHRGLHVDRKPNSALAGFSQATGALTRTITPSPAKRIKVAAWRAVTAPIAS